MPVFLQAANLAWRFRERDSFSDSQVIRWHRALAASVAGGMLFFPPREAEPYEPSDGSQSMAASRSRLNGGGE